VSLEIHIVLPILWILVGVGLGALFLAFARAGGRRRRERRIIGVGLVIAALFYVGFALRGGAPGGWLAAELAGTAIFGVAAVVGVRWSAWVLALGWGTHVLWDLLLHRSGAGSAFTPDAYPWMCVGFDLLVAGYVAMAQVRGSGHTQDAPRVSAA
jgi:hypothetical protein